MKRRAVFFAAMITIASLSAGAETPRHYENRLGAMLDFAVRMNSFASRRLEDRALCAYVQAMAQTNVTEAEQMTPPPKYAMMHPHFLLVLMNVERAYYYAAQGNLQRYRHHQNMVRKELQIFEDLARKAGIDPYFFRE